MSYKAITIAPNGEVVCETHKKHPQWQVLQKYVGGMFQIIPYFSSMELDGKKYKRGVAYCHEEGWTKGMEFNKRATDLWMKACPKGDPERMRIAGTLLFVVKEKSDAKT